jgi:hypothetical protein
MGVASWLMEHHPQARMNRVIYDMQQSRGGLAGFKSFGHESMGFMSDAATVGLAIYTRGVSLTTSKTQVDAVLGQGIFYDPGKIDVTSYGVAGYNLQLIMDSRMSPRQDMTLSGSPGRQIPKTRGGTKSSRGAKSPQTLKPFWSNGKPKCREGYRYDFKRKMCVKKS